LSAKGPTSLRVGKEAFVIARTALVDAVVEYNAAQVRLLRATGEASETALAGQAISAQ